jgi:hypothetical protein
MQQRRSHISPPEETHAKLGWGHFRAAGGARRSHSTEVLNLVGWMSKLLLFLFLWSENHLSPTGRGGVNDVCVSTQTSFAKCEESLFHGRR